MVQANPIHKNRLKNLKNFVHQIQRHMKQYSMTWGLVPGYKVG